MLTTHTLFPGSRFTVISSTPTLLLLFLSPLIWAPVDVCIPNALQTIFSSVSTTRVENVAVAGRGSWIEKSFFIFYRCCCWRALIIHVPPNERKRNCAKALVHLPLTLCHWLWPTIEMWRGWGWPTKVIARLDFCYGIKALFPSPKPHPSSLWRRALSNSQNHFHFNGISLGWRGEESIISCTLINPNGRGFDWRVDWTGDGKG